MAEFEPMENLVKVIFALPSHEFDQLQLLAARRGVPITLALRQSLATRVFIEEALEEGSRVALIDPSGSKTRLNFYD